MERASDPDSREMKNHRNCLIILDIIVVVLFSKASIFPSNLYMAEYVWFELKSDCSEKDE